jgi:hypothetical protein
MNRFVDINKAKEIYKKAKTINKYELSMDNIKIRIESFDYGKAFGWDNDIRHRVFVDDQIYTYFKKDK